MKLVPRIAAAAACATGVIASIGFGSLPADATSASHARGHLMTRMTAHGAASTTVGTSMSNAGYLGFPASEPFTFQAQVFVPQVQCDQTVKSPIFIDALANGTLPDSNLAGSGLQIIISCTGPTASYTAGALIDEVGSPMVTVTPNDVLKITGSVSPTHEHYVIADVTKGTSHAFNGAGLANADLQYTTQSGFGTDGGFAPFQNFAYYNLTVNNQPFSSTSLGGFSQVDGVGNVMVQTTPLNNTGKAFGLIYKTNVGVNPTT
jgi:hypothetical protein